MQGSLPRKIGRLVADLTLHPRYLRRYTAHNVLNGTSPLDLEMPWFSYAAIDFLEDYLRPHMAACEYGAGGSTLFLARRVQSLFSIEDKPAWFERVSRRLQEKSLRNVELKLCPFDFKNPAGFEQSEYLRVIPEKPFDVIVVDGSEEWVPVRPACFAYVENRIKPGGIMVVDDSWRYPALRANHHGVRVETFRSVGPCRPGVTSTDVFFY